MKTELLAPAGDMQAAYAALFYGADALYLGLRQFSARATATNFSFDELCEITGYAHAKGAKIYVTINTLLQQSELSDLTKSLDACVKAKVDAVILQDLGVARVIREKYPELEMHASTQMAVHNWQGALALQKLGFTRVVLAREMTLPEIKKVAALPNLETEAFIHGALCYAYSGLCLFSSMESAMSANRGKCLYPCRALFDGDLGKKHLFSMKDMALEEDVLKMPVTSLKIEGRKKSALYVAAVTNYYRRLLDKKPVQGLDKDIQQIFARPWTKFHFNGKNKSVIDPDFVGHRGLKIGTVKNVVRGELTFKTDADIARYDGIQIDVAGDEKPFGFSLEKMRVNGRHVFEAKAGDVVEIILPPKSPFIQSGACIYLASSTRVKGAYHYEKPKDGAYAYRMPIDVTVRVGADFITADSGDKSAAINDKFSPAKNIDKVNFAVTQAFEKVGDTSLCLNHLTFENPDKLFVPVSVLNDLRRRLYEQIEIKSEIRTLPQTKMIEHGFKGWIIKTDRPENLPPLDDDIKEVIIALSPETDFAYVQKLPKNKVRLALPTVCRNPDIFRAVVTHALDAGYKKWEIGNVWALALLPEKGVDISFDNSLYTLNTQAIQMARDMGASRVTLSFEDTADNLFCLVKEASLPVVFVAHSDVPLFTSANCIRPHDCKHCKGGVEWFHLKKGADRYQALSQPCQTMVFNDKALYLGTVAKALNPDFIRLDFMYKTYSAQDISAILAAARDGKALLQTNMGNWQRRI